MKNKTDHHGLYLNKWEHEIQANDKYFFENVQKFLEEIDFMQPFYQWKKEKQKRIEQEYYTNEKKLLAYLKFGKKENHKNKLTLSLLQVYQTLFFKQMGWYQKSPYKCLQFSSTELKSTLEGIFIESLKYYISIHEEVRTPFGSFIKNRLFIRFRGELQDLFRKRILYEQWKDKLYERSKPTRSYEEEIHEFEEMSERLELLKENFLFNAASQTSSDPTYEFMYNFLFVYFFFDRKSLSEIYAKTNFNYKQIVNDIKIGIKDFKEQIHGNRNRTNH